jgi:hypothetical protein
VLAPNGVLPPSLWFEISINHYLRQIAGNSS